MTGACLRLALVLAVLGTVIGHSTCVCHMIAVKCLGALLKSASSAKGQQFLHWRFEIVPPPDNEIIAFAQQRYEIETILACDCLYGDTSIGGAFGDCGGNIAFCSRWLAGIAIKAVARQYRSILGCRDLAHHRAFPSAAADRAKGYPLQR